MVEGPGQRGGERETRCHPSAFCCREDSLQHCFCSRTERANSHPLSFYTHTHTHTHIHTRTHTQGTGLDTESGEGGRKRGREGELGGAGGEWWGLDRGVIGRECDCLVRLAQFEKSKVVTSGSPPPSSSSPPTHTHTFFSYLACNSPCLSISFSPL